MAHMKFAEYLTRNKKLVTSAPVKIIADFEGTVDHKPAKEEKHKEAGGKGQSGDAKPYKGGTDAKDPNKGKLGDGFANKGDSKLKYEPKNGTPQKEGGKKTATWPKTKTQEWIDRTKDMSLAEFTKTVRGEALKGLEECACQDAPHNSIKETVHACKCNKQYVSSLVREMKRNGLFGKLVSEMVNHPETFKALAILMERDEAYARKLAKAMNEMVAPPMGDEGGMGVGGPPMHKMKKKKKPMLGMGDDMGAGEEMPHPDDMHGDDMGDDMHGDGGDEDDLDIGDDEDTGDIGGDDDMDSFGGEDDDMGLGDDDLGIGGAEGGDDVPPPPPHDKIKAPKKKHNNLLAAMKGHPALMGGM